MLHKKNFEVAETNILWAKLQTLETHRKHKCLTECAVKSTKCRDTIFSQTYQVWHALSYRWQGYPRISYPKNTFPRVLVTDAAQDASRTMSATMPIPTVNEIHDA